MPAKRLIITADSGPPDVHERKKLLLEYGGVFIGCLAIDAADYADFLLSCREGFPDVAIQQFQEAAVDTIA